jgi:hypothetical protein
VVYGKLCYYSYYKEHLFAYSGVLADAALAELSLLLDIVNSKIKALAHRTKDLGGIQRDETGQNWT